MGRLRGREGDAWSWGTGWLGRGYSPASSSATPSYAQEPFMTRPQLYEGLSTLVPKCTFCAQLPEGSSVMQTMENPLFSLKSTFDIWLNSSSTSWVIDTILTFLCGLGLFFLILPYLESNPSFAPPRKHGNIRKVRKLGPDPQAHDCFFFSIIISTFWIRKLEALYHE